MLETRRFKLEDSEGSGPFTQRDQVGRTLQATSTNGSAETHHLVLGRTACWTRHVLYSRTACTLRWDGARFAEVSPARDPARRTSTRSQNINFQLDAPPVFTCTSTPTGASLAHRCDLVGSWIVDVRWMWGGPERVRTWNIRYWSEDAGPLSQSVC